MKPFNIALICLGTCLISFSSYAQNTIIKYLSGTGNDNTVDWDFYCTDGQNSGKWTTIPVPSCWELQGFGEYNYGHVPFEKRLKEKGWYKYRFEVPQEWQNKVVNIVFEGVMTDAEVKINGKLAGPIHQGAFYEFKYNITNLLRFGRENELEVEVRKFSANQSVNIAERKADFWIFGGVFRPVYLEIKPVNHIERVAIDARANGALAADVFFQSIKAKAVQLKILDSSGTAIYNKQHSIANPNATKLRLNAKVEQIKPWNPELPTLYTAAFTIIDDSGELLHEHQERIGFRTIEVREKDGIYLNGTKIKFKGINRHSFWPTSGRTTSKKLSIQDVSLIKEMNMNAIRMSHYPPDKHLLDACDSLGLLVIDELCTWQAPALDTVVAQKLVKELVVRDVNHPSVVLWANGNEGGFNYGVDDDYAKWDIQKREVIHPWETFRKTNTVHYIKYNDLAMDNDARGYIFFPTEFIHGLDDGGHGAGLEDYWRIMWQDPLCAGGFLWVFADEAVVRTDRDGTLDSDGNHAPDGVVGPYREKEGSFFAIKEIWSPIHLEKRYITPDFDGRFKVENRYHFTQLDQCKMRVRWVRFEADQQEKVLSSEMVKLPALKPGERGEFTIDLPYQWKIAHALSLSAFDPSGKEVFTWSFPVQPPASSNGKIMQSEVLKKIEVEETARNLLLKCGDLIVNMDKETGILVQVEKSGQIIPIEGPFPVNKGFNSKGVKHYAEGNDYVVQCQSESGVYHMNWTFKPNGLLNLEYQMFWRRGGTKMYEGITFSYPEENIKGMQWLGDGPYRVWKNRRKGVRFGLWQNDYNNTITGYTGSDYDYPEFKGFYSNIYRATIQARDGNDFTIFCNSPEMFFRMLSAEERPDVPREELRIEWPPGDISFLKTIAPIGTKFKKPGLLGPQSQEKTQYHYHNSRVNVALTFDFN